MEADRADRLDPFSFKPQNDNEQAVVDLFYSCFSQQRDGETLLLSILGKQSWDMHWLRVDALIDKMIYRIFNAHLIIDETKNCKCNGVTKRHSMDWSYRKIYIYYSHFTCLLARPFVPFAIFTGVYAKGTDPPNWPRVLSQLQDRPCQNRGLIRLSDSCSKARKYELHLRALLLSWPKRCRCSLAI